MHRVTKNEIKSTLSYMSEEDKILYKKLFKQKIICEDCGRKLGKKSLEEYIYLCGVDDESLAMNKGTCIRCMDKEVKKLQDTLSFAVFGEEGHYDRIDFDDFPGFRD